MVVKSVACEVSQLKSMEENLFKSMSASIPCAQVGLVVGKLRSNSDRGFVYALLPTPPTAEGSQACTLLQPSDAVTSKKKKGGGGSSKESSSSLIIDAEWVAEHALQVSRMVVGGMDVVGIYLWSSESSFKASMPLIYQVIKGVAQVAPLQNPDLDERLLIHISHSPKRWTCHSCMLNSMSYNFQPCDLKMVNLLSSLQYFKCKYNFEIRLPIYQEEINSMIPKVILYNGIKYLAKELKNAKPLIDGDLVNEEQQFSSVGTHEVELLLPFMSSASMEACRSDAIAGIVVFSGTIFSFSYLGLKIPISQAVTDIKGDIITSLKNRVDIIFEESGYNVFPWVHVAEASTNAPGNGCDNELMFQDLSKNSCSLLLPKRVLIPWLPGIFICDYLKQSETFEDVKDHCKELLSMETCIDTNVIQEYEKESTSLTTSSFWNAIAIAGDSTVTCSASSNEKSSCSVAKGSCKNLSSFYLIAFAVAIVSLLVGWYIINVG